MDTSQIRSEISSLQSECSQIESENNSLRNEISDICNSVQSAANSLGNSYDAAKRTLDDSTDIIAYAENTLKTISKEQDDIEILYHGFKNIETANKKIRELNNKIYFEFSSFRTIRKIARAFIDNITLDIVTPDLIYKSVEKEHLQSPDFWLSYSMLAIMHWKDNNENSAIKALEQAMKLDERETILFFMSFNFLLERKEAALKWFECYKKLEKTGNDAEFILLLLHATNLREDVNDPLTKLIKSYLVEEYKKSIPMNQKNVMVENIKNHLVQCNSSETFVFDYLRNYVKDYPEMATILSMAKDNTAILDFVEKTNTISRGKGYLYIERFINTLLDTPDKKERIYTDEIDYNEAIIKCVGDLSKADKMYNEKHDHATAPLNLMQECIEWLFAGQSADISDVARSNIFLLCRNIIKEAAQKYFSEYRSKNKTTYTVRIKDYLTQTNFEDKSAENSKIEEFYNNKKITQLATVKNTSIILCIVFAVICFISGIVAFIYNRIMENNYMFIIMCAMLILTVFLSLSALIKSFKNKKKRKNIVESIDSSIIQTKSIVDSLFDEFKNYQSAYEDSDHIADEILFAIKR